MAHADAINGPLSRNKSATMRRRSSGDVSFFQPIVIPSRGESLLLYIRTRFRRQALAHAGKPSLVASFCQLRCATHEASERHVGQRLPLAHVETGALELTALMSRLSLQACQEE